MTLVEKRNDSRDIFHNYYYISHIVVLNLHFIIDGKTLSSLNNRPENFQF